MIGFFLMIINVPFAVATLLPYSTFRQIVLRLGVVLLWVVGAISGLILVQSLLIIPSQNYRTTSGYSGTTWPDSWCSLPPFLPSISSATGRNEDTAVCQQVGKQLPSSHT